MTHRNIPRWRERVILCDTAIRLNQVFARAIKPRTSAHNDTVMVIQEVYCGHLNHKPNSANKIALALEMPRTTVIERLKFLEKHDYIKQKNHKWYVRGRHILKSPANIDEAIKIILQAAVNLSKSDTMSVV